MSTERETIQQPELEPAEFKMFPIAHPKTLNFIRDAIETNAWNINDEATKKLLGIYYFLPGSKLKDLVSLAGVEKAMEVKSLIFSSLGLVWDALPDHLKENHPKDHVIKLKNIAYTSSYKKKMSERFKGKPRPPEFVAGMSQRTRKVWKRPGYRKKIVTRVYTDEHRMKISKSLKGRPHSPERIENITKGKREGDFDKNLWKSALLIGIAKFTESGFISPQEMEILQRGFETNQRKHISKQLMNKFSIAVANLS